MKKAIALLSLIKGNGIFVLKVCCVGLLLGLIVILSTPREYSATIYSVVESTKKSVDQWRLMSGDVIDNRYAVDAIRPTRYGYVLASTPFLTSLFDIPVTLSGEESETMPLYEYLSEHQRYPWWAYLRALPSQAIGLVTGLFSNREALDAAEQSASGGKAVDVFRLTRRQSAVVGALRRRVRVGVEAKRRTVTLNVRMQDPAVAAVVADSVSARLQAYVNGYRARKEHVSLEYMETVHKQAYNEYCKAQEAYAEFYDKNRDLALKTAQAELRKLSVNKALAYNHYSKISRQLQQVKSVAYRERSVYTVIEPARVNNKPVAPQKSIILVVCILLSVAVALGWLWLKKNTLRIRWKCPRSIRKLRSRLQTNEK